MGDTQIFPGFPGSPQVFTFNQNVSTSDYDIHNIFKMMFNEGNFGNHNIHIFQNGMFPPNMP